MPPFVTYTRSASPKLSTCTAHFDALFGKIHEALARHIPTTIIKMSSSIFTQQRETLYYKYKRLNKTIFKMLDPKGLLKGVGYEEATQIAQVLARDLAENLRDPVCNQLLDAIECRTEWGKRYKCAPQHMYDGHKTYINFLQGIQYQLSAYKKGKEATIEVIEQQLKAGEEEEGTMDDTKAGLTLEQAEFLAFLASLMALASEAAALWGEVAQGKLPIWTASTLTDILLHEAENLIHVTRLLNEEEELSSELLRLWTASTNVDDEVSQPQIAQDWVDALDKANDAGSLWRELATLLPGLHHCATSLLWPSVNAAADVLSSAHRPYVFNMLHHGIRHIGMGDHPTSVAQVPLVTLVAIRFCLLVTSKGVNLEAARKEARAELSGTLALLPRLCKQKALTEKEINKFRNTAKEMKAWAEACTEPISLGTIHAFARMHWVQWYVRIIGTNSLPLQTFLYLYEKRRLQASRDINDDNDDKRLIGALLEDKRIAPYLLQDGRPKTVSQCIKALRNWCHLPTLDGRTLDDKYIRQLETSERMKGMEVVEYISTARSINSTYMYERIMNNNYSVTKEMYMDMSARLPVEERRNGLTDPTLLRRYLIWEMDPPSCFELEAALFKAVQKTPEWEGLHVISLLGLIPDKSKWWNEVAKVIRQALEAKLSSGYFIVNDVDSLQIALLKAALGVTGYEELLKAALISAVKCTPGWRNSLADYLLESAMPEWRKIFRTFKVEPLARSLHVISGACMEYLVPINKERKNQNKTQNQVTGELFESFMADARPILEKAYGKDHVCTLLA